MRDELVGALRALRSTPGQVSAGILTLALAIGICVFVILASAMTRRVRVLNGTLKRVPVG